MWAPVRGPGFEHCRVDGNRADGIILGLDERTPYRAHYTIEWDDRWRTRSVRVEVDRGKNLSLIARGDGSWSTGDGKRIEALQGCIDVDLSATPFTNTLPVRRLALGPLASAEVSLTYVELPSLRVGVSQQRYTCLVRRDDGTMHRFESGKFRADIVLDADGLVVEYPRLFTRVWPRS
jgi:hypothetical protein